jgi:predicted dehydrogenase
MADDLQPEDSQRDAPPFRIATVGLSQNAIFHLEAAAIRDGLQPVVAARTDETNAADEPVPGCPTCSLDALVDRSDIDVVFVCGPVESRIDTAVRLLQSQQHIVVEPSADLPPELIERLIDESSAAARCCSVWRPHNSEPDFRRAAQVVASGEAGSVRAVRFLQHQMAAALLPDTGSPGCRDQITHSTLRDQVGHRLAQALTLINEPVKSVTASFGRAPVSFGTTESAKEITPAGDTSVHVIIEFESGASALLDIALSSVAPISTGWIMQGTRGGYHSERQHITVEDGEIYDVAVEIIPLDPYQHLREQLQHWPEPSAIKNCQTQLHREAAVASILRQIS